MTSSAHIFPPVAIVESCFKENFGIPRQPGLVPEARGRIRLLPPYDQPESVRGLEGFSHIWVMFIFHHLKSEAARATVRPPRLGGNTKIGVFASRATHRPNPLGLSLLKLDNIETSPGNVVLNVSGLDMLDGTPVLDIKPYLPYAESIPGAAGGYASEPPAMACEVVFSELAQRQASQLEQQYPHFSLLLTKVLGLDPRPAYHREDLQWQQRVYGLSLYDQNIRWQVDDNKITVIEIEPTKA